MRLQQPSATRARPKCAKLAWLQLPERRLSQGPKVMARVLSLNPTSRCFSACEVVAPAPLFLVHGLFQAQRIRSAFEWSICERVRIWGVVGGGGGGQNGANAIIDFEGYSPISYGWLVRLSDCRQVGGASEVEVNETKEWMGPEPKLVGGVFLLGILGPPFIFFLVFFFLFFGENDRNQPFWEVLPWVCVVLRGAILELV